MAESSHWLIFPHQLFVKTLQKENPSSITILKEPLFFGQDPKASHRIHLLKAYVLQRALEQFQKRFQARGIMVKILEGWESLQRHRTYHVFEPSDDWISQRLQSHLSLIQWHCSPGFLTERQVGLKLLKGLKQPRAYQHYIAQRKARGILMDSRQKPLGGKFSLDMHNRKPLGKGLEIPPAYQPPHQPDQSDFQRLQAQYPTATGDPSECIHATTREEALEQLEDFLDHRLNGFGPYEDAMLPSGGGMLFHSGLSVPLNLGLLEPEEVLERILQKSQSHPLASIEGFVRQILGFREYVRLIYLQHSRSMRTQNYFGFQLPIPEAVYHHRTGLMPLDQVLEAVSKHAWCHHIERLMILGSFFMMTETHPDAVYNWFLGQFADGWDWVMVPNVYGMSQFADGGSMTTKPYLSGSAYLKRMGRFPKGIWMGVWDALYWRFIHQHRETFIHNHRTRLIVANLDSMEPQRLGQRLQTAELYLDWLHRGELYEPGQKWEEKAWQIMKS